MSIENLDGSSYLIEEREMIKSNLREIEPKYREKFLLDICIDKQSYFDEFMREKMDEGPQSKTNDALEDDSIYLKISKSLKANVNITLKPKQNSILSNCSNVKILEALKEAKTSKQFMETTEQSLIENISNQIEDISGYNPITGKKKLF